ncbi:hypothetical protein CCP2SC5_220023 [Azospirillaceae bacterium]
MTLLLVFHRSRFKYLKSFYNGFAQMFSRTYFPGMPSYERFVPLMCFIITRMGRKTDVYYIDATSLSVCHNRRIGCHKIFPGLAQRGKTSMEWCFGFKLHPVDALTKGLVGKIFGDEGYIEKDLAEQLL